MSKSRGKLRQSSGSTLGPGQGQGQGHGHGHGQGWKPPQKADIRIKAAYCCPDPLLEIDAKFRSYFRNDLSLELTCVRSSELTAKTIKWMVDLTEENMKSFYEESEWGWNRKSKEKEFKHRDALVIVARYAPGVLEGLNVQREGEEGLACFVHFRFSLDEEGKHPVVYCHELQVPQCLQRKGIGGQMMEILKQFAIRFKMTRVMLTCFRHNPQAFLFYTHSLGYAIDNASPSNFQMKASYEILSLRAGQVPRP